jgi:hypothetical protein
MRTLIVTGTFNDYGGRPSKIGDQFTNGFRNRINVAGTTHINGGSISLLTSILNKDIKYYDAVIWFPNISNDYDQKLVSIIKRMNKTCTLVTSKRNLDGKYSLPELINRALVVKANLFVEITKQGDLYTGRLLDPLGNCFMYHVSDFGTIGSNVALRVKELRNFTRLSSIQWNCDLPKVPNEEEFFDLIRTSAEEFQKLIPAPANPERFVGNASFRCQNGYPSFKNNGHIFVSRRNIDKTKIILDNFVAVQEGIEVPNYIGNVKPSVDTPIHISLYKYYSKIKYIMHGHIYLAGIPTTTYPVPCGALEEAGIIIETIPDWTKEHFALNLKGHGFIALADSIKNMKKYVGKYIIGSPYKLREMPEHCLGYYPTDWKK